VGRGPGPQGGKAAASSERDGNIVFVSRGSGIYCASKHALEGEGAPLT
jgi:hypothetical protein